jgi:glucose-6-phosphate isomerase
MADVVPPVRLSMIARSGTLIGRNGRYERSLGDLGGLYRDDDAYQRLLATDDRNPVYWVEKSQTEDGPRGSDPRHQHAGTGQSW